MMMTQIPMMMTRTVILALLMGALVAPVAAQDDEAWVAEAIQPLVAKCPEVSAMVERWKTSPPGAQAKLVRSWQTAPIIERRSYDGFNTENEWGSEDGWEADDTQKWGGNASSLPVLGGRMILDVFQLRRDNNAPGKYDPRNEESGTIIGVTGQQDGGYVSVLTYVDSPDCFIMKGTQVAEEIHLVGDRGQRRLGLRSHSLKLSAVGGKEAMEIVYERSSMKWRFSIRQQAGCHKVGTTDCSNDTDCCGNVVCVEETRKESSQGEPTKIIYQNFCRSPSTQPR